MKRAKPTQMERVQAARCYINQTVNSQERAEDLELEAFMSIFHPEVSADKVLEMRMDRKRRPR